MNCFIIALESEGEPLFANMTDLRKLNVYGKTVVNGKLCGREVCVIICGVGKVNAASATQYAIDCLGAEKIINIGVAGGLNDGLAVGEIYGISQVVQYDFDLTQINGTPVGTLNEFDKPYLPLAVIPSYENKSLATGDRFNDDLADFTLLTDGLQADIRDMECGAIAQVCAHAGIPCFSFKCISDIAGNGSTTDQFVNNLKLCANKLKNKITDIAEKLNG